MQRHLVAQLRLGLHKRPCNHTRRTADWSDRRSRPGSRRSMDALDFLLDDEAWVHRELNVAQQHVKEDLNPERRKKNALISRFAFLIADLVARLPERYCPTQTPRRSPEDQYCDTAPDLNLKPRKKRTSANLGA